MISLLHYQPLERDRVYLPILSRISSLVLGNHMAVMVLVIKKLIGAEWRICASVYYPSLVQITACHLLGAKSFSESMLDHNQLEP